MQRVRVIDLTFTSTGDAFTATDAADRTSTDHDWFVSHDIGSVCRQLDNETRWRITAVTSGLATWAQILQGTATAATIGVTSSAGTLGTGVASDHVHAHGTQTDPTLHADATASADGFMTKEHVVELEGVGTSEGVVLQLGTGTTVVQTSADALLTVKNTSREARIVVWTNDTFSRHVSHGDEIRVAVHWLDDDTQEIEQLDVAAPNVDAGATPSITVALPNAPDVVLSLAANHKLSVAVTRPTDYPAKAWARIWLGTVLTHTEIALPPAFASATCNNAGDTITLTYAAALNAASAPAKTAFTLIGTSATINTVTVVGSTVVLALTVPVAFGDTVTFDYTIPATNPIQSAGGVNVAALSGSACANVTPPTLSSVSTNTAGTAIVLTFGGNLDTGSVAAKTCFTLHGTTATVGSVGVAGAAVTLTLTGAVLYGETVTVDYAVPVSNPIQQLTTGYDVRPLTAQACTNIVPTLFVSATTDAAGATVTVTWGDDLDPASVPAAARFSLAGTAATIASTAISLHSVVLTLTGAVLNTDTVTVDYTAAANPVQTANGVDVANLSGAAVTNMVPPIIVSIVTNAAGDEITMTYDGALDAASTPAFGDFAIAGDDATVDGATVAGSAVTLTLTGAIEVNDAATLSYTAGANPIRSATNTVNAANLVTAAITNMVPPVFVSGATNVAGTEITLTYDGALDETSEPAITDYTIIGDDATVATVNVTASTVVLTLTGAIENGDVVTLNYVVPGTGMVRSATNVINAAALTGAAITNNVP